MGGINEVGGKGVGANGDLKLSEENGKLAHVSTMDMKEKGRITEEEEREKGFMDETEQEEYTYECEWFCY